MWMPLYSTSRRSKLCDTSTQRRNPLNNLYQCLLDTILELGESFDVTADSGKPTGFPACAYPSYTAPVTYHTVKLSYSVDNPGEVGSTAVYPPSWIRVNSVCKVALQA